MNNMLCVIEDMILTLNLGFGWGRGGGRGGIQPIPPPSGPERFKFFNLLGDCEKKCSLLAFFSLAHLYNSNLK